MIGIRDKWIVDKVIEFAGYHKTRLQRSSGGSARVCLNCYRRCVIPEYETGACNGVINTGNELISTAYGLITSEELGTVEQLDVWHYKTGSRVLQLGSMHCNFGCDFCMNKHISHTKLPYAPYRSIYTPEKVIEIAKRNNVDGIVFAYSELTQILDFVIDIATLAKQNGLYIAAHTNGSQSPEAVKLLAPLLDAVAISYKALGDRNVYSTHLRKGAFNGSTVLENMKRFYDYGVHLEISTQPIYWQKPEDLKALAANLSAWIARNLSKDVPVALQEITALDDKHIKTGDKLAVGVLDDIAAIMRNKLNYVYLFKTADDIEAVTTRCPQCDSAVVERYAREVMRFDIRSGWQSSFDYNKFKTDALSVKNHKGYCTNCGYQIYGTW